MHVSIAYACQEYKTSMAEISGPVIPLTLFSTKSMCCAQQSRQHLWKNHVDTFNVVYNTPCYYFGSVVCSYQPHPFRAQGSLHKALR